VILVDTSVWVEHLRRGEPRLAALLGRAEVMCHPFIVGELACGNLRNRTEILDLLQALPSIERAPDGDVLELIGHNDLHGSGLGLVDVHLLASCMRSRLKIWTLDVRLARAAAALGVV
jgi:predicted nucleic acid-binding protein